MYYLGIINLWHNCINIYGIISSTFPIGYLKILSDLGINETGLIDQNFRKVFSIIEVECLDYKKKIISLEFKSAPKLCRQMIFLNNDR